jgi:hypothetical protein
MDAPVVEDGLIYHDVAQMSTGETAESDQMCVLHQDVES